MILIPGRCNNFAAPSLTGVKKIAHIIHTVRAFTVEKFL
jgi:hypothetical protein